MSINLQIRKFIINNYDMTILITCTFIDFKINRIVKSYYVVIISTYTIITILFKIQNFELSSEKDYFFQLHVTLFNFEAKNNTISYIMNVKTFVMHVQNVINKSTIVFKYIKFDKISNFEKKNCYHVDSTNVYLIIDIN